MTRPKIHRTRADAIISLIEHVDIEERDRHAICQATRDGKVIGWIVLPPNDGKERKHESAHS